MDKKAAHKQAGNKQNIGANRLGVKWAEAKQTRNKQFVYKWAEAKEAGDTIDIKRNYYSAVLSNVYAGKTSRAGWWLYTVQTAEK